MDALWFKKLETLENKIHKLLDAFSHVKDQNQRLKEENEHLKSSLAEAHQTIEDFKNQQKIDMIATGISGGNLETTELRATIDGYIKEIDKCIAYLNE